MGVIATLAIAAFAAYGARRAMGALLNLTISEHGLVWGAIGLLLLWGRHGIGCHRAGGAADADSRARLSRLDASALE